MPVSLYSCNHVIMYGQPGQPRRATRGTWHRSVRNGPAPRADGSGGRQLTYPAASCRSENLGWSADLDEDEAVLVLSRRGVVDRHLGPGLGRDLVRRLRIERLLVGVMVGQHADQTLAGTGNRNRVLVPDPRGREHPRIEPLGLERSRGRSR